MEPAYAFAAIALLIVGLVGQAFGMRRIAARSSGNPFLDRSNIKWYVMIGAGMALWYVAGP